MVYHEPGHYFGVAFIVKNVSRKPITVRRISSTDAGRRLVRLVGVRVSAYPFSQPFICPGSCPAPPVGLGRPPYRELPPFEALTLKPGGKATVALHFRGVGCGASPHKATETDNQLLNVEYEADGRNHTQLLRPRGAVLSVSGACGPPERP